MTLEAEEAAHAPALVLGFVSVLLEEVAARSPEDDHTRLPVAEDWDAIWAASKGSYSPEVAVGHALATLTQLVGAIDIPVASAPDTHAWAPPDPSTLVIRPIEATTEVRVVVSAGPAEVRPAPVVEPFAPIGPKMVEPRWATPVLDEPVPVPTTSRPLPTPTATRHSVLRHRLAVAASWVRNIGVVLILFAGWQVWGTSIEQAHAQQSLRSQFTAKTDKPPASFQLASATAQLPQPAEGSVVARLQIPAVGIDQYVVQGSAAADLARGPGHYIGTALPGQQGNVAIAGHRTTHGAPFNALDKLAVGDPIVLTTSAGERLTYAVSQLPVAVPPSDVAVLNDFGDNRLTLTTCTPKFSAAQRLVVVATLQTPQGVPTHHSPRRERLVSGSQGWNLRYLPGVALLGVALIGLGVLHGRITRRLRTARWVVLGPIWLAAIYFVFVALSGLLPATL